MNLKNGIFTILLTVITLGFAACNNLMYEDKDELNRVYDDSFTLVSRTRLDDGSYCSIYSTEKLQKEVTVYVRGNWNLSTWYSNYDALKYEHESNETLGACLEKELYLEDDEFEVSFDNKFYTTAYESRSFESFYRERLLPIESNGAYIPNVINYETVSIKIKESAVNIRKDLYVKVVERTLKDTLLSSKMIVTFINERGEKVDEYEFNN